MVEAERLGYEVDREEATEFEPTPPVATAPDTHPEAEAMPDRIPMPSEIAAENDQSEEVDFSPGDQDMDEEPEETGEEAFAREERDLDILEPRDEIIQITIGDPHDPKNQQTYEMRPLSYFAKIEFISLVADSMDKAMSGDDGLTVANLIAGGDSMPQDLREMTEADTFIRAIVRLTRYVPDFMLEAYCIWLGVPRGDRYWAKTFMEKQPEEGGLSDEDGQLIIETFMDQNLEDMVDFFGQAVPKLIRRARQRVGDARAAHSSKQSKPSRQSARKQ
jgi:hypothetical protein